MLGNTGYRLSGVGSLGTGFNNVSIRYTHMLTSIEMDRGRRGPVSWMENASKSVIGYSFQWVVAYDAVQIRTKIILPCLRIRFHLTCLTWKKKMETDEGDTARPPQKRSKYRGDWRTSPPMCSLLSIASFWRGSSDRAFKVVVGKGAC